MEPLEVVEQVRSCLVTSQILAMVHALPFEHSREALAGCIVGAVADRAHAAHQHVAAQELLTGAADELTAAIGVLTFDSSRLRRAISSSRGVPRPENALPAPASASRTQRSACSD